MDNIGELEDDAPQPNLSEDGRFVILDQSQNLSLSHEQNVSANQEHNGSESEAWSFDLHKRWACLQIMCRMHSNYYHVMCFYCLLLCLVYANSQGTNMCTIPGFTTQQLYRYYGQWRDILIFSLC